MKRVVALGIIGIVGVWTFKHYTGVMATQQYTSGGLMQLSVPFTTTAGTYKLESNKLTLDFGGNWMDFEVKSPDPINILLSGDHLTLLGPDGGKQTYTRVSP